MNIDDLTLGQVRELRAMLGGSNTGYVEPFALPVGSNVVLRTVTMIYVGRLVAVGNTELVLENAAWIADTRRWADFLAKGVPADAEVEPYEDGKVCVGRGALVDACLWSHDLLREQQ